MHNIVGRTIQHNNGVYRGESRNISRLPCVTRNSIQDEHIMFREPNPVQIQGDDLFGEREVLVFEQEAELKHTVNEVDLLFRISSRPVHARNGISQFRPEIEVMTPASEHALLRKDITEWTLADAGWAEKED
jgi:hypothetical protein